MTSKLANLPWQTLKFCYNRRTLPKHSVLFVSQSGMTSMIAFKTNFSLSEMVVFYHTLYLLEKMLLTESLWKTRFLTTHAHSGVTDFFSL